MGRAEYITSKRGTGDAYRILIPEPGPDGKTFYRALIQAIVWLRRFERVSWEALPSFRLALYHHNQSIKTSTLYEAAGAVGLCLDYREDWEEFAAHVAEHLPSKHQTPD